MKNREEIKDLLNESLPAFNTKDLTIKTKNGVPLDKFLNRHKNIFLKETINHYRDQLIDIEQQYPKEDKSEIQLTTDFFILPRHKMQQIKELLDE